MSQITIETKDIMKMVEYACCVLVIIFAIFYAGTAVYNSGRAAGIESVPTPTPTPVPTPTPAPTPTPVTMVAAPIVQVPTIDYLNDIQSVGTNYGYICLVDSSGNEYLVMNFDPGTAELTGASYSGTVVGTYNGIPELENVALTSYPRYYYPRNQPSAPVYYHRDYNRVNNRDTTRYGMTPWGIGVGV